MKAKKEIKKVFGKYQEGGKVKKDKMTEMQKDSANYVRTHHNAFNMVNKGKSSKEAEDDFRLAKIVEHYTGEKYPNKLNKWHDDNMKNIDKGKKYDPIPTEIIRKSIKTMAETDKKKSTPKMSKGGKVTSKKKK